MAAVLNVSIRMLRSACALLSAANLARGCSVPDASSVGASSVCKIPIRTDHPTSSGKVPATAGLSLLVYGLTGVGERGLGQPTSWLPLLLAVVALVILVRHESRTPDPLLPLGLLRSRAAAGANLTAAAITAATSSAMYLSVLYVQQMLRVPAGRASLLFPALNLAVIAGSLTGPRLLRGLGARRTLLAGFGGIAGGIISLLALPSEGCQWLGCSRSWAPA
jgi:hypothetical protein